jgi:hypothetical protein
MSMSILPDAIRQAVELAPGSARQLCRDAGVDQGFLSRILAGKEAAPTGVGEKLADALARWQLQCAEAERLIRAALQEEGSS